MKIKLYLVGALLALVGFGSGCATHIVHNNIHKGSQAGRADDTGTKTNRVVAGIYHADSAANAVFVTNADKSYYADTSTETSKGFESPGKIIGKILLLPFWFLGSSCMYSYSTTYVPVSAGPDYYYWDGYENVAWYNNQWSYYSGGVWVPANRVVINHFDNYRRGNSGWSNVRPNRQYPPVGTVGNNGPGFRGYGPNGLGLGGRSSGGFQQGGQRGGGQGGSRQGGGGPGGQRR